MTLRNLKDLHWFASLLPVLLGLCWAALITSAPEKRSVDTISKPWHHLPLATRLGESLFVGGAPLTAFNNPEVPQSRAYRFEPSVRFPLEGLCHPLNGEGKLSQGIRGVTHQGRMEYAYDLTVAMGTPVYAMQSGTVLAMESKYPDSGGGRSRGNKTNYLLIQHQDGYRAAYVHLQRKFSAITKIKPGAWIAQGQLIALSGNSGWTTGPHLHLEMQIPSKSRNFVQTVPFSIRQNCNAKRFGPQRSWLKSPDKALETVTP